MPEQQQEIDVSIFPDRVPGSRWDAVFLFDLQLIEFQDYLAWFWAQSVSSDGDCHEEWLASKAVSHDPRYETPEWRRISKTKNQVALR
jgi:hypothetical protein